MEHRGVDFKEVFELLARRNVDAIAVALQAAEQALPVTALLLMQLTDMQGNR